MWVSLRLARGTCAAMRRAAGSWSRSASGTYLVVLAVFCCARVAKSETSPDWAGQGGFRLLVEVETSDIGGRNQDELPAEVAIDPAAFVQGLDRAGRVNVAAIQVMAYDPASGKPLPYGQYAYARSPCDRPFRWYDAAIPYQFPEVAMALSRTRGELRRTPAERAGFFYNVLGDWRSGRLAWVHTQTGQAKSCYAIYFDLLAEEESPEELPPQGWIGDGSPRCDIVPGTTTGAGHTRIDLDDWDGDGRIDVLFGDWHGTIWFHRNTGSSRAPQFDMAGYRLKTTAGVEIKVGPPGHRPQQGFRGSSGGTHGAGGRRFRGRWTRGPRRRRHLRCGALLPERRPG